MDMNFHRNEIVKAAQRANRALIYLVERIEGMRILDEESRPQEPNYAEYEIKSHHLRKKHKEEIEKVNKKYAMAQKVLDQKYDHSFQMAKFDKVRTIARQELEKRRIQHQKAEEKLKWEIRVYHNAKRFTDWDEIPWPDKPDLSVFDVPEP
jgi:hypothetical protein